MPSDRCVYCGTTPPPKLHGDHLIPRHRGGPESGDNLVWACRSCNSSKNARDLLDVGRERDVQLRGHVAQLQAIASSSRVGVGRLTPTWRWPRAGSG
ncbi:HNH endonuclease [Sorangium cellulosum]|uniref:HNH endonuclease n=1 Tax=Sorangium cellulosum TaxID=56 RepID=UPI0009B869B9